jgi:geranylgeranyl pyrophosphate synthase
MSLELTRWAAPLLPALEQALHAAVASAYPPRFAEACRYPLDTGGKRVRPLLTLAAAEALGAPPAAAAWAGATAVELVHTYSLVHDDLPAMDDDDLRRGRPTVHRAFDEASAILVGDALLTAAFAVLAEVRPAELGLRMVGELAQAAGHPGMVGGQALDIGLGGAATELGALHRVHAAKTGALIRCAVRLGALAGGATPAQLDALTRCSEAVGLAFQLADDVLDADQDAGEHGPPSFVRLLGVDGTRALAEEQLRTALAALEGLPQPAALAAIARYAVERDR